MKGIVKSIFKKSGFGFIRHGTNEELFFCARHTIDPGGFDGLKCGDWIRFDPGENNKGAMAINVRRVMLSSIQKEAGNFNKPKIKEYYGKQD